MNEIEKLRGLLHGAHDTIRNLAEDLDEDEFQATIDQLAEIELALGQQQTEQQPAAWLHSRSGAVATEATKRAMEDGSVPSGYDIPLYAAPIAQTEQQPGQSEPNRRTLQWVVDRWHAEVANRPLVNVHRRTLDSTWRQMIRHLGEDDVVLLGPRHDDMLDASGNPLPQYAAPIAQTAPRGETK